MYSDRSVCQQPFFIFSSHTPPVPTPRLRLMSRPQVDLESTWCFRSTHGPIGIGKGSVTLRPTDTHWWSGVVSATLLVRSTQSLPSFFFPSYPLCFPSPDVSKSDDLTSWYGRSSPRRNTGSFTIESRSWGDKERSTRFWCRTNQRFWWGFVRVSGRTLIHIHSLLPTIDTDLN